MLFVVNFNAFAFASAKNVQSLNPRYPYNSVNGHKGLW